MKVKIIKKYKDTELNRLVEVNEELEVTKKRGEQLVTAKVGIVLEEATEEAPKKKRERKKASEPKTN